MPGAGDVAVITNTGTYNVTLNISPTLADLELGDSSGVSTQTLSLNGQTLTLNGVGTVNSRGLFNLDSGTFAGSGACTVNGFLSWTAGVANRTGPLIIGTNGTLQFITGSNHDLPGVTLTNNGTVLWSNGNVRGSSATRIHNNGLWRADTDYVINNVYDGSPGFAFNNGGTFRKSAGTGTTTFGSIAAFNNAGTLDVQSGTVDITGGGINTAPGVFNTATNTTLTFNFSYTFNDGSQFTGPGDMRLVTGTFTLSGNITFTKLTQAGGTLAGNSVFNGNFTWDNGIWSAAARTIASGSTLNITTVNNHDLPGVTLTNNGTVVWSNGNVRGSSSTIFYNNGLWRADTDNVINNVYDGSPGFAFNNGGTFRKSAGTGTTTFGNLAAFNNTGTLDVQSGTVSLAGSHTLTGGKVNIGISSLTSFGKVVLSGASAFTGNFSANLNGGYIPITNNSFPVITYGSLSGSFANYSLPFADAWTTNYSPTTFSLYVLNARPIPPSVTNQIVSELTPLVVTNTAIDLDVPANSLAYALLAPPAGATISSSGIITWTPDETQGPGTNLITTVVTDNGVPALSATNSFIVVVQEVNVPPALSPLANTNVNELITFTLTNSATDIDIPANILSYQLLDAPAGATIDTNGVITWTPTEAQGPGTNTFTTVVTDYNPDAVNEQYLTVTNIFEVVVNEVNVPPVLIVPANTNISELVAYSAQAIATDADLPANALNFTLISGPGGLTVSPAGLINWTPAEDQGPSTNTVIVRVTDLNPPAVNATSLSVTSSYTLIVQEVNVAPVLIVPANTNISELVAYAAQATATDADIPTNALKFALVSGPSGLTVSTNGLITWTPSEEQGPSTNMVFISVSDTNPIAVNATSLSVTSSFQIVVGEVNIAPVLGALTTYAVNPGQTVSFTATATDADLPTNTLTFSLVNPPAGATISPGDGTFNWRPAAVLAGTTNVVQVRVQDNGVPAMQDTKSFSVVINPLAPVQLAPISYSNGQFRFQVSGTAGPDYVTEASTNFGNWLRVGTNLSPALPFEFTDLTAGTFSNRAYRVRLQP